MKLSHTLAPRLAALLLACGTLQAQRAAPAARPTGPVRTHHLDRPAVPAIEIGDAALGGILAPGHGFGGSVAGLGDFDHDGVPDLVVSDLGDPYGGDLHLLFLRRDGTLREHRTITPASCGCPDPFVSVDRLADLDHDGVVELIAGTYAAALILFLNADGTVRSTTRIASDVGGFVGPTPPGFGIAVTRLGDLDGDGTVDAAVGSHGGVEILFLSPDGTVRMQQELDSGVGGFPDFVPNPAYSFGLYVGLSVDALGDLDRDGVGDLLVAGWEDQFEGETGHFWVTFLNPDGTVREAVEHTADSLGIELPYFCCWYGDGNFARSVAALGDADLDGATEIAVGVPYYDLNDCTVTPSAFVLSLAPDGSALDVTEIGRNLAPYDLDLEPLDLFGWSLASPGDVDGDGRRDLVVGAPFREGVPDLYCEWPTGPVGAIWVLLQRP